MMEEEARLNPKISRMERLRQQREKLKKMSVKKYLARLLTKKKKTHLDVERKFDAYDGRATLETIRAEVKHKAKDSQQKAQEKRDHVLGEF